VPDLATLPPLDVAPRMGRLRGLLPEAGVDALLVTRLVNIRYLTGFTGSAALLLVTPDDVLFVSDGRYADQAEAQLAGHGVEARIRIGGPEQRDFVVEAAQGLSRVGLEAHGVTWAQARTYGSDWLPDAELVPTEHLVEGLRRVKDAGEVARIRAACAIADEAFAVVSTRLDGRPSERDVAIDLEFEMRRRGATANSFDPIVASGPNGAMPHARPSARGIEPHELVVFDFGCIVDGYCSDMTRTISLGEPSPEAREIWELVLESQQAGSRAVVAGASVADVDKVCRDVIDAAGLGERFTHSTGHGVGLEIHEAPRVARTSEATLGTGQVVTVEPGVYLPEHGGVRVEDTVVVTEDGCRALTLAPKDPVLR
jgi:Xaa-Pro aminopeptidase